MWLPLSDKLEFSLHPELSLPEYNSHTIVIPQQWTREFFILGERQQLTARTLWWPPIGKLEAVTDVTMFSWQRNYSGRFWTHISCLNWAVLLLANEIVRSIQQPNVCCKNSTIGHHWFVHALSPLRRQLGGQWPPLSGCNDGRGGRGLRLFSGIAYSDLAVGGWLGGWVVFVGGLGGGWVGWLVFVDVW